MIKASSSIVSSEMTSFDICEYLQLALFKEVSSRLKNVIKLEAC